MNLLNNIIDLANNINYTYCPLESYLSSISEKQNDTLILKQRINKEKITNSVPTFSLLSDTAYQEISRTIKTQEKIPQSTLIDIQTINNYLDKNLADLLKIKDTLVTKQLQKDNPDLIKLNQYLRSNSSLPYTIYHSKAKRIENEVSHFSDLQEFSFDNLYSIHKIIYGYGANGFYEGFIIRDCPKLTTLNFPALQKAISPSIAFDCPLLSTVSMPNLESLHLRRDGTGYNQHNKMFEKCPKLTALYLPKLKAISCIGNQNIFEENSPIKSITLSSPSFCQIYSSRYKGYSAPSINLKGITVYVPQELLSQYQQDERWIQSQATFQTIT